MKELIIISFFFSLYGSSLVSMESGSFLGAWWKNAATIGAIAPSSEGLAQEITKYYPSKADRPLRILEVGAGTGVFTKKLQKLLRKNDTLDVIELTPDFISQLMNDFGNDKRISIHWADILKFDTKEPYDLIVSGLPFNSFNAELVKNIITRYIWKFSKNGTIISFFEYQALPSIRQTIAPSKEYTETRTVIDNFIQSYQFEQVKVMLNIPPAVVHHLMYSNDDQLKK